MSLTLNVLSSSFSTSSEQYLESCSGETGFIPATPSPYLSYASHSSPQAGVSPMMTSSP